MILASAQTKPKQGDVKSNLIDHYNLIEIASENQVDLIVFPEMSITGYERENALSLAFTENDSRLENLRQLSVKKQMILVAGAPILINNDLYIGALIIKPDYSISVYTKQYLYFGEEGFFKSSFDYNPSILINQEQISFSICADIENPLHPKAACKLGTTVYISSIFFTHMSDAYKTLSGYASRYNMNVLMSNFCGHSWGRDASGQSGFWDKNGKLIASLNNTDSGLLIVENVNNTWVRKAIIYKECGGQ